MGALSNLKVVEYSQFTSGPYCAKLLADLGAEVIKIEPPGLGDKARNWGPFPQDIPHLEKSGLFLWLNNNKLGVTLNLNSTAGVKIFQELIRQVDILVEANPHKEMERLGLDYENLHQLNPRLVVTSITPFGHTGPYRHFKGCDLVNFNMSGGAYMNPADGVDNLEQNPPLKAPLHFADFTTGLTAAISTMSAVIARKKSGLGQHIELSQQEALAATVRSELMGYTYEGILPGRGKGEKKSGAQLYPCKNGYVMIHALSNAFWPGLVKMMDNPEWTKEEWCKDYVKRSQNFEKVTEMITEWTRVHTTEEINQAAIATRIPSSPVRTVKDLLTDEQLTARDFFVEIDHPVMGKLKCLGAPYKLSATPWTIKRPAPLLGEHNEQVYCQRLGYSRQDLVKLRQAGVV